MTLTTCLGWYGAPAMARAMTGLGGKRPWRSLLMLRRAQKILRCVIFIYARYFNLDAVFAPSRKSVWRERARRIVDEDDPATWSVGFLMPARMRPLVHTTNALQPFAFQSHNIDPMSVIARRMEGLRRVLTDPMRHVRRIARALTRETFIAEKPPERRRPAAQYRDLWDALEEARHMLWWAFCRDTPRFDSS